jgi:AcrR family transcriptional regulator
MVEAVRDHGYRTTTVSELSRLAGVSKRTFYERFPDKDACFRATHEMLAQAAMVRIEDARRGQSSWQSGTIGAIRTLSELVAERPKEARFVLLEAHAAGSPLPAGASRSRAVLEAAIGVAGLGGGEPIPAAVPLGIACGLERVLRRRLLNDREAELPQIADDLAVWVAAYGGPASEVLAYIAEDDVEVPLVLGAAQSASIRGERARILRATAELLAVHYPRPTVEQIAARAGTPPAAVTSRYETTESCILEALDLVAVEALAPADAAMRATSDPVRGLVRGLRAVLLHVAADPVLRGLISYQGVDASAGAQRGELLLQCCADVFTRGLTDERKPTDIVLEATIGAIWGVVQNQVLRDRYRQLPLLAGDVAYLALGALPASLDQQEKLHSRPVRSTVGRRTATAARVSLAV